MNPNILTRELSELEGTCMLTLSQLEQGMASTKTPLTIATTLEYDEYEPAKKVLPLAGWRSLGQRVNPNSGNLLTLWFKRLPIQRLSVAAANELRRDQDCCGLRISISRRWMQCRTDYLAVARIEKGARPPKGWHRFACFRDCSYWTNLTPPKGGRRRPLI